MSHRYPWHSSSSIPLAVCSGADFYVRCVLQNNSIGRSRRSLLHLEQFFKIRPHLFMSISWMISFFVDRQIVRRYIVWDRYRNENKKNSTLLLRTYSFLASKTWSAVQEILYLTCRCHCRRSCRCCCLQQLVTEPYREPAESNPYSLTLAFKDLFLYYVPFC
jgi:hypothetical protein